MKFQLLTKNRPLTTSTPKMLTGHLRGFSKLNENFYQAKLVDSDPDRQQSYEHGCLSSTQKFDPALTYLSVTR